MEGERERKGDVESFRSNLPVRRLLCLVSYLPGNIVEHSLKLPLVVTAAPRPPRAPTLDLSPRIRDEKTPETEWETTSSGRHTKLRFYKDGEQEQRVRSLEVGRAFQTARRKLIVACAVHASHHDG